MSTENIFSALAKYNSAVDENYLTESFVYTLNELLSKDTPVACRLLNYICVNNSDFTFDPSEEINISTQEVTELGIPDVKISTPNKLIYIEVKHKSQLGEKQISRYTNALLTSDAQIKYVILLTRYDIDWTNIGEDEKPYKHIKWLQVYQLLSNELNSITDPVNSFLVRSFMQFLEVKQMSIQKVGWEYIKGIPEMINLMSMIEFAIQNAGINLYPQCPRAVALEWRGFYLETNNYLCGIFYEEPTEIFLQVVNKKGFDKTKVPNPSYTVTEDRRSIFSFLSLEDHHFFSLNKEKQVELITNFVQKSFAEAKKMKVE